ncbi:hypothetical protein [Halanaerobaculum tunisiense]
MKKVLIAIALVLVVSLSGVGQASEVGGFGTKGLLTIPTADILRTGDLNLEYQMGEDMDLLTADYGLREGVQIGVGSNWDDKSDESEVYSAAKIKLFNEDDNYRPQVSYGVTNGKSYLVASKTSSYYNSRFHLGVGDEEYFADRIFAGISKVINPVVISSDDNQFEIPIITLMAEYNDGVNLGTRFNFDAGVEVDLGFKDLDEFTFSVGVQNKF